MTSRPREQAEGEWHSGGRNKRRLTSTTSKSADAAGSGDISQCDDEPMIQELVISDSPSKESGLFDHGGHDYIRLLGRSLEFLGFDDVAKALEKQSGVQFEDSETAKLKHCVLVGDWEGALQKVPTTLGLNSVEDGVEAKFYIYQEKFIELVQKREAALALACLRNDITPLGIRSDRLKLLATALIAAYPSTTIPPPLLESKLLMGRWHVLLAFQHIASPGSLIGWSCSCDDRLQELVEQALTAQIERCAFHNTLHPRLSLMSDYKICGSEQVPQRTTHVLKDHLKEVLHLQFSHNGEWLVTAGDDAKALVWKIDADGCATLKYELRPNRYSRSSMRCASWSPDDSMIATCGDDSHVNVWTASKFSNTYIDFQTLLDNVDTPLTAVRWLPDNKNIVTGGKEKDYNIIVKTIHDNVSIKKHLDGVQDLVVAKNGRYVLAATPDRGVLAFDLNNNEAEVKFPIAEDNFVLSLSLCRQERYLLTTLAEPGELCMWDLGTTSELIVPASPCGLFGLPVRIVDMGKRLTRACFGGVDDRFVLCGTSSSKGVRGLKGCAPRPVADGGEVLVYLRATGELMMSLSGHTGTVNSVAWNPMRPDMFASASDDGTVRLWGLGTEEQQQLDVGEGGEDGGTGSAEGGDEELSGMLSSSDDDTPLIA